MAVQKGINPISYRAESAVGQYEPVKFGTAANSVVSPSATTDKVVGVTQLDQPTAGGHVPVETTPGAVVKMRVGVNGVTGQDSVTIDSTDKTEIDTLTKNQAGVNLAFEIGVVDAPTSVDYAENEYAPIRLVLADAPIT